MSSLQDVLARGQGIERPFRCEAHDDKQASASVNVVKMVWHCYACNASGRVDPKSKRAPELEQLQAMLDPEGAARVYPEAYLELFDNDLGNWSTRFPKWVRWKARLGGDPVTLDATFPVHTPRGKLAGVGRRIADPGPDENRFRYPPRWAASQSLFLAGDRHEVVLLTEGASDAVAGAEVGVYSAACYGAGLHAPQYELLARLSPKLVLLGFDADDAGQRAIHGFTATNGKTQPGAMELLRRTYEVAAVDWSEIDVKDAAGAAPKDRIDLIGRTVAATHYGAAKTRFRDDAHLRMLSMQAAFWSHQQETQDG